MKEFLIHKLHGTSNLEAINLAVMAIFVHLRKVRTTNYPAQRAIYLVEAISRDLNTQLLKVRVMNSILAQFSLCDVYMNYYYIICIYTHVHVRICHCSLCAHCTVHVYLLYM